MKTVKEKVNGFTLVELVITIAVIVILSVISVPIYKNYTLKAKVSEAYVLLYSLRDAHKLYYAEHRQMAEGGPEPKFSSFAPNLGIDARGNKYFTRFCTVHEGDGPFTIAVRIPDEFISYFDNHSFLMLKGNVTEGSETVAALQ